MEGATNGGVKAILRIEGLCVLIAACIAYANPGNSWSTFALFFLLPDLSFAGYLAGPKAGAVCYNAAHSYIGAVATLTTGFAFSLPLAITAGLIWCAHIGFDRALGYGLKYGTAFQDTHLGPIGRNRISG